jgi:hypothetical protein
MVFIDPLGRARILARSGEISQAVEEFMELVIAGNSQAMVELAIVYARNRHFLSIFESEIVELLQRAIHLGNSDAERVLEQFLLSSSTEQNHQRQKQIGLGKNKDQIASSPKTSKPQNAGTNTDIPSVADSNVRELRSKAQKKDHEAMYALASLYVNNPHQFSEELLEAFEIIMDLQRSGNARSIELLIPLAYSLIYTHNQSTAEIVLYESLLLGEKRSIPLLLDLLNHPSVDYKLACRDLANSANVQTLMAMVHQSRKMGRIAAVEFWLIKLKQNGSMQAVLDLAKLYRSEMNNQEKFESLLQETTTQEPFQSHMILAQLHSDQNNFPGAIEELEKALAIDNKSVQAMVQVNEVFAKWKKAKDFIDWLLHQSRRDLIPLVKEVANRFKILGDSYEEEIWKDLDHQISRRMLEFQPSPSEDLSEEEVQPTVVEPTFTSIDEWIDQFREQIEPTYIHRDSKFLRTLFSLQRDCYPLVDDWMNTNANEDWLDEILAKYEDHAEFLDLDPVWPKRFESPELQIVLSVEGQWIRGWVGRGGSGGLVAIRLKDFEFNSALRGSDLYFSIGVIVSFFIDQTFNVKRDSHPHFEISPDGTLFATEGFKNDVFNTRQGLRYPMRSHMVSGFPRTLPKGQTASLEALMRAPIYVRRNLKPNQTFVRQHQRNGPVKKEVIIRYLETNSNLADAIGSIKKFN